MRKHILSLLAVLILIVFVSCATATAEKPYTCEEAAIMLCVNADAYSDPAPTVRDILGPLSPNAPLTRIEGCRMLLRAFGPLPDVQEGVRYIVKYRDCAFEDIPEDGKEAVENLTNAGLYIPENNTVFGPDELMTEDELAFLVDRIHAYLQSSLKDDYYSCVTADMLNAPDFLEVDYHFLGGRENTIDKQVFYEWTVDLLNECLENPDTPEKANIAALMSTYMDMEERENGMTYVQPMVDAIWNAADYKELMNVLAHICRETGIELLLDNTCWYELRDAYTIDNDHICYTFSYNIFPDSTSEAYAPQTLRYRVFLEQKGHLFSLLGFGAEETEALLKSYLDSFIPDGFSLYGSLSVPDTEKMFNAEHIPEELSFLPLADYLRQAGYENDYVAVGNLAETVTILSMLAQPQYLTAMKTFTILHLIRSLIIVCPLRIMDASDGFLEDFYAAEPSMIFEGVFLNSMVMPLVFTDTALYFSKTEECRTWHNSLEKLCSDIKSNYRRMLENITWISESSRRASIAKLDAMKVELLVPTDFSNILRVEFTSAEDGGTFLENIARYLKARRRYLAQVGPQLDAGFSWSINNNWTSSLYYEPLENTFFLCFSSFICSHTLKDPSYESLLANIGIFVAHEISHGFDYTRSIEDNLWSPEDLEEFNARCEVFADYMGGYEFFPGFAVADGHQILDESVADLTAFKCIMGIASQAPGFDYDAFFRDFADLMAISATRTFIREYYVGDSHASGRCRVNKLLPLLDEFYATYDICEGDAMYVAPQNRLQVW